MEKMEIRSEQKTKILTLRKTLGKLWKPLVGVNICAIGFVAVFPIVELNVNCPPALTSPYWNTLCLQTKTLLWHSVYELSLRVADDYPPMIWENDGFDRTLNNVKNLFIALEILVAYKIASKLKQKKYQEHSSNSYSSDTI